jgi:2-oxoisovalerate dehydrogenase E1 component
MQQDVPEDYFTLPIGKAKVLREGKKASIITYGMGVHWALKLAEELDVEIVDLRTLLPLDTETIYASVKKTGKALILHEDTLTGGIGAEISALISEHCFQYLDAPVLRVASLDTAVPFQIDLEKQFLANRELEGKLKELLGY